MAMRDDALVKAAQFVLRARDAAGDDAVATVGQVEVEPGAVNVIPGRVIISLDLRAPDGDRLDALARELGVEPAPRNDPIPMDPGVRAALAEELAQRGMPPRELVSWAGHDAGVLAAAGVPSGMLFVRSLAGGASHTPDEYSSPEDVELAVDVLAGALARLAVR
jgi:acetylornithine deacetylase/succinyl-diaminopimelate desuccinylase-like protein